MREVTCVIEVRNSVEKAKIYFDISLMFLGKQQRRRRQESSDDVASARRRNARMLLCTTTANSRSLTESVDGHETSVQLNK